MITPGRRVEWSHGILAPGEYAFGPDGAWHAATPNGLGANLGNHEVIEYEDGTITVAPSTLVTGHARSWHGYLEYGQWRTIA